ncbi:MAG: hypothetical protein HRU75_11080 [Planctomycetia bacterium]|nr:MAG: hypothetical protein HRU75_11080 [Planctomycetia bacterium]
MSFRFLVSAVTLAASLAPLRTARADDVCVIDLTNVVLQHATNQSRSSNPDDIDPGYGYEVITSGMAQGTSGLLQLLFPQPTPLATILETLQPGSSALLEGVIYNPSGQLPIVISNQTIDQSSTILGTNVRVVVTISAGIDANGYGFFSLTDVQMLPNTGLIRLGAIRINSGQTVITRIPAITGDMNWDGQFNNFDIDAFVLALLDPAGYETTYGYPPIYPGDINRDGQFNNFDIDPFVALLVQ